MRPRRAPHLAAAVALTLCMSASAGTSAPSLAPVVGSAAAPTLHLRSSDSVAPLQVLVAAAPAASTTVAALPQVPLALSQAGIPGRALVAYRAAAERVTAAPTSCRLPWPLLAAIGFVESGHGSVHDGAVGADGRVTPPILGPRLDGSGAFALIRDSDGGRLDGDPTLDRAVGPMQFIPSTWARHGADGDGNGSADPHDLDDAALSAARYLCQTSRSLDRPAGATAAVFSYNHSYDYVRVVLTAAARYAGQSPQRWGVGLLPAASAATAEASPEPVAQSGPALSEPVPTAQPTVESGPLGQPSPQGGEEPSASSEPTPSGEPPPPSEPAPQPEPSAEGEPAPEEQPGPSPAPAN